MHQGSPFVAKPPAVGTRAQLSSQTNKYAGCRALPALLRLPSSGGKLILSTERRLHPRVAQPAGGGGGTAKALGRRHGPGAATSTAQLQPAYSEPRCTLRTALSRWARRRDEQVKPAPHGSPRKIEGRQRTPSHTRYRDTLALAAKPFYAATFLPACAPELEIAAPLRSSSEPRDDRCAPVAVKI
ncbi:hypothetical protein G3M48_007535 [Beauveria asiatica]|uniref:Uncharacterized protein n=1 Tax=Beauveria asiatica TaxID=1069075 RepID=A0AAW0RMN8_9HYPO